MHPSWEAPREKNGNPANGHNRHKAEGEEGKDEEVRDGCCKLPDHQLPADKLTCILSVVLDGVCHDDSPVSRHVRGAFGALPKSVLVQQAQCVLNTHVSQSFVALSVLKF